VLANIIQTADESMVHSEAKTGSGKLSIRSVKPGHGTDRSPGAGRALSERCREFLVRDVQALGTQKRDFPWALEKELLAKMRGCAKEVGDPFPEPSAAAQAMYTTE